MLQFGNKIGTEEVGKSLCVPVLCPCRVPGLEMGIPGHCWLLVWAGMGRTGRCRAAASRDAGILLWGQCTPEGQLGGMEVTFAGGTPGWARGEPPQEPRGCSTLLAPRCLGSFAETGSSC